MKKRNVGGVILSILLGIIAALLVVAVAGYIIFKTVLLPKYTQKLADSGHSEIAEAVGENANLGTLASLGSLLSDRGVMNFLKNLDRDNAKSMLDVLDSLDKDYPEQTAAPSEVTDETWQVPNVMHLPTPTPVPTVPSPKATSAPAPSAPTSPASGSTAYERISAVASPEEVADGLRILSKLDMGYISSLTAGGLTSAEKSELKAYVQSVLSGAEISRALSLYRTYSKYL